MITDVFSEGAFLIEEKGALDVPEKPGLGIEVDMSAAREYVDDYERVPLPSPVGEDGAVLDW